MIDYFNIIVSNNIVILEMLNYTHTLTSRIKSVSIGLEVFRRSTTDSGPLYSIVTPLSTITLWVITIKFPFSMYFPFSPSRKAEIDQCHNLTMNTKIQTFINNFFPQNEDNCTIISIFVKIRYMTYIGTARKHSLSAHTVLYCVIELLNCSTYRTDQ